MNKIFTSYSHKLLGFLRTIYLLEYSGIFAKNLFRQISFGKVAPGNMPKKEPPPPIRGISASDFKNRKRLIKILVDQRLSYGKSVLYDTTKGRPRYPIDIIGSVLQKAEKKARAIGRSLNFSKDETDLISQIFKALSIAFLGSLLYQLLPLAENCYYRADPDFIEKGFGLDDDAIEKTLGLPDHSIEKFFKSDLHTPNVKIHGPIWDSVASL